MHPYMLLVFSCIGLVWVLLGMFGGVFFNRHLLLEFDVFWGVAWWRWRWALFGEVAMANTWAPGVAAPLPPS